MTEVTNELPVHETYRNCEIYGLQPPERIIEARHQIDVVYRMRDPRALAAFACEETNSPEARLLAKHKALASREERQRGSFDVDYLQASTIGIERTTSQLGRLMGHRQAEWWPREWLQPIEKGGK